MRFLSVIYYRTLLDSYAHRQT